MQPATGIRPARVARGRVTAPADFDDSSHPSVSFAARPAAQTQDERIMHRRVSCKYGSKWGLDENVELQVRAPAVEGLQQRKRENGISERAEADQENPGDSFEFPMQAITTVHIRATLPGLLLLYGCLVDQHDRDVIANGVYTMAFDAFQPGSVRSQSDLFLAQRTRQYFQKVFTYRHETSPWAQRIMSITPERICFLCRPEGDGCSHDALPQ